jgi:hypothetical protein
MPDEGAPLVRKKIALSALGLGLAVTFLPVTSASASCISAWTTLTGDCSPCNTLWHLGIDPGNCIA